MTDQNTEPTPPESTDEVFDPDFVKPENKRFVVFGFHL